MVLFKRCKKLTTVLSLLLFCLILFGCGKNEPPKERVTTQEITDIDFEYIDGNFTSGRHQRLIYVDTDTQTHVFDSATTKYDIIFAVSEKPISELTIVEEEHIPPFGMPDTDGPRWLLSHITISLNVDLMPDISKRYAKMFKRSLPTDDKVSDESENDSNESQQ